MNVRYTHEPLSVLSLVTVLWFARFLVSRSTGCALSNALSIIHSRDPHRYHISMPAYIHYAGQLSFETCSCLATFRNAL
ncbi:hypothetical protein GALMADRAFT_115377 [Galerina marginata CBS 339.88]|uniref:Uncharacterized protein n=1 Tax=Galerina marginata (strain CBS 339.88) TaxID=685588 RepID=A0A067TBR7_GALM3|nr:hypothetical protein GALMADRAFT_115377 [Galerina marginata CBS 339.88]